MIQNRVHTQTLKTSEIDLDSRYLTVLQTLLSCALYFVAQPDPEQNSVRGRDWTEEVAAGPVIFRRLAGAIFGELGLSRNGVFRQAIRIRINDRIRARRNSREWMRMAGSWAVMPPFEAIKLAKERGLDLVEISPTADPPVCKITDYGKYLYQTSKKAHEQRKHQKGSQLKEVKDSRSCSRGTRFSGVRKESDHPVPRQKEHKVKAMIFHRGRRKWLTRKWAGPRCTACCKKLQITRWWKSGRDWKQMF